MNIHASRITTKRIAMATTQASPPQRRQRATLGRMARQEEQAAYLFLLPWLLGLILFLIGPILASIAISLTNWNLLNAPQWVGLANYREMFFDDRNFQQSIRVTLKYAVLSVPLYMV